ncbi:PD-(D/E)XK nuclease family protein [Cellulophaga sp. L1A9]|uniref:PD-(D/E)XK nuclease family protein n=1 Tax=Cellulophaga sp. L1A9 TaxID=2686362 RepID=UPI001E37733E|nr:PD-(D/E)XK nuclease family protein [Cellulophaga sp. L1A9]
MMQSFIEEVVQELIENGTDFTETIFILPSKRAGTFLKNTISKNLQKTIFAPDIYSIESFIEQISGLNYASSTEQLFTLYKSYLATSPEKDKDSFLSFSKWGQTVLQDFNEIDRYLVDTASIFSHLSAIQELNTHFQDEPTQMIADYVKFWNNLEALYTNFNQTLIDKNLASQGYAYRTANTAIADYIDKTSDKKFVFIGFNALNKAEENIIQQLLEKSNADIYWDIDTYFLNDTLHDASLFIRQHKKTWSYFKEHSFKGISAHFKTKKNIQLIGVPKNVSQAKYVGNLLEKIQKKQPLLLKETAIVLGDENLLNPILNAIPEKIARINITMGYPIHKTPIAVLFNLYFEVWLTKEPNGWFYQQLLNLLAHPYLQIYYQTEKNNNASAIANKIKARNWIFVKTEQIEKAAPDVKELTGILFDDTALTPKSFIKRSLQLINVLKQKFQESGNSLGLEYLFRFHTLFNQLELMVNEHAFITDIKSLQSLYKELIGTETLDFQGEPLQGTQIMGMLESRNLDFETVIITSVNEGILPSGKSNNSFIPFDLKKIYGLPTYKEKDAVYTYHFYRLLQRAKNVYLIYNTEPNVLEGNEKSRLLTQLLTDDTISQNIKEITGSAAVSSPTVPVERIEKSKALIAQLKALSEKGFSPTSLSNYVRNPIDFYKKSILRINDINEVEESLAANTFGTIVHDTLEDLYQPFVGEFLNKESLEALLPKIEGTVKHNFAKTYADGDITRGKNLIAYTVILRYIENFIKLELKEIKHQKIKIVSLEQMLNVELEIPGIPNKIRLKGKLDRVDEVNGVTRIIDYKTGKVESRNVKITDWNEVIENYDKSKAFQLLCYAIMIDTMKPIETIKAGIISFKNLNSGTLYFSEAKTEEINKSTLLEFKSVLDILVQEIFNPEIPFIEKEV